jgi:hypothetical protein
MGRIKRFFIKYLWTKSKCIKELDTFIRQLDFETTTIILVKTKSTLPERMLVHSWWTDENNKDNENADVLCEAKDFLSKVYVANPNSISMRHLKDVISKFNHRIARLRTRHIVPIADRRPRE